MQVRDSSRYFVLKITSPDGRHAFIGLAFNDRNHSFDFNVALQEFEKVRVCYTDLRSDVAC